MILSQIRWKRHNLFPSTGILSLWTQYVSLHIHDLESRYGYNTAFTASSTVCQGKLSQFRNPFKNKKLLTFRELMKFNINMEMLSQKMLFFKELQMHLQQRIKRPSQKRHTAIEDALTIPSLMVSLVLRHDKSLTLGNPNIWE